MRAVKLTAEVDADSAVLTTDAVNAYNEMKRRAMLKGARVHMPQ